MNITTDDLLDAIREALAQSGGEEGETVTEMSVRTGLRDEYIRRGLKVLIAKGEWEAIRVRRPDISGRVSVVPAYRAKK